MYPHERSLVEKLTNKPFALLGINSDPKERVVKAIEENDITWRSWWDGGSTQGPIATKWNVSGWPTIYVLDAKGVIRFKNVRGPQLDAAVDELLAELGVDLSTEGSVGSRTHGSPVRDLVGGLGRILRKINGRPAREEGEQ
jgi:hypothetical protein